MGSRAFESGLSSLGDVTIYSRKVSLRYVSIIESAFCGQTFLWNKGLIPEDSTNYTETTKENTHIIHTVLNKNQSPTGSPEVVWVIESMDETFVHSTSEAVCYSFIGDRFDTSINPIKEFKGFITNLGLPRRYIDRDDIPNVTLVSDPALDCLIEFICSQQMSMDRIHSLNNTLKQEFGSSVDLGGHTFNAYPTLEELSNVGEDQFRDLSFGYRSKYLVNTVEQIATGDPTLPPKKTKLSRSELHSCLSDYYGVGDKIADCVQLYSYNHSVVPMDTWTKKLADALEPSQDLGSYTKYQNVLESQFRSGKEGLDQLFAYDLLTTHDQFLEDVSQI